MMLWRGHLLFHQYIKNKCHKYGLKYYELCTNDGLILRTSIYGGKSFEDTESLGHTGAIVLNLMSNYLDKGYHLYNDNYYNSVQLFDYLTTRSTYAMGTLHANRKTNPKEVISKNLKKGEFVWRCHNNISANGKTKEMFTRLVTPIFLKWLNLKIDMVRRNKKQI